MNNKKNRIFRNGQSFVRLPPRSGALRKHFGTGFGSTRSIQEKKEGLTTSEREEFKRLQRENLELKKSQRNTSLGIRIFREGGVRLPTAMTVAFIDQNSKDEDVWPDVRGAVEYALYPLRFQIKANRSGKTIRPRTQRRELPGIRRAKSVAPAQARRIYDRPLFRRAIDAGPGFTGRRAG